MSTVLAVLAACASGLPASAPRTAASADGANQRHSPLTQLTPANVRQLQPAWQFATGAPRGQEGGPLVLPDGPGVPAGGLLLLHTPLPNKVFALGLTDHALRWTYVPQQDPQVGSRMCCDVVNRGLATGLVRGRTAVFLQQADTTLVALDAASGAVLWQVRNGDPARGETNSNAPLVAGSVVLTGNAGGEYGVRGSLTAYAIDTGRRLWRGHSVGPDADLLIDPARSRTWRDGRLQPVGPGSSLATWRGDQWQVGGGTVWGWLGYDPALRLVFYGSGNPGSWNPLQRPGDNKWAMSLWARDVDSGLVRWVYQMTPHDEWDYDGVNEPILFEQPGADGRPRRLLAHFDRNGFAYVLDRATGALLSADKFDDSVNWATHVDLQSGRPVVDPAYSPAVHGEDVVTAGICPAAIGSKNQAPASYSPALGWFFVPTNHLCMDMEPFHVDHTAGQPFVGANVSVRAVPGSAAVLGRLIAWDPAARRIAWSHDEPAPVWSGALSTATGLVFHGTLDGRLKALDARSGATLWVSPPLPSGVVGNVASWMEGDRQMVGVLTGIGGLASDPDGIGGLRKAAAAAPSAGVFVVFAMPLAR